MAANQAPAGGKTMLPCIYVMTASANSNASGHLLSEMGHVIWALHAHTVMKCTLHAGTMYMACYAALAWKMKRVVYLQTDGAL